MLNVLFLCADNAYRSIIAEALTNRMGQGHVRAFSAGEGPAGTLYPDVRALLDREGLATEELHPKSLAALMAAGLPPIDLAICLCDNCGGELCTIPDGVAELAHWQVAEISGRDAEERNTNLQRLFDDLRHHVGELLAMPSDMGRAPLVSTANHIGWRASDAA